jgi:hypothetical protein
MSQMPASVAVLLKFRISILLNIAKTEYNKKVMNLIKNMYVNFKNAANILFLIKKAEAYPKNLYDNLNYLNEVVFCNRI